MSTSSSVLPPDFAELDRHFAEFIGRFGGNDILMPLVAATLSRSTREGNICLPLAMPPPRPVEAEEADDAFPWPAASVWRSALAKSKAVGGPKDRTPLVLDESDRLYLRRYWDYQHGLAIALREKAAKAKTTKHGGRGTQMEAIEVAVENQLTFICGGPGTGKTATVPHILARLFQSPRSERLRVALTAPTGKAATRLEEAVRTGLGKLTCPEEVKARIPVNASTIHRLLGVKGNSIYFRHDRRNPLPLDLLVIDEASMVALPLLSKLFDALPAHCRVVLLGDRDQLASVEPGAVLADIVDAASAPESPLHHSVVTLQKNYRFAEASGPHHLCLAVREGNAENAVRILREQAYPDLVSSEFHEPRGLVAKLAKTTLAGFSAFAAEKEPVAALAKLNTFRILSPLHRGPLGVRNLNRNIERILQEANLIPKNSTSSYSGKPILITKNDYQLQLYNGDVGILLPDVGATEDPAELWAWFIGKENTLRRFAPARLPEHQTAYAMTVHKSQGSEFDRVLFILPEEHSPILTRELVYTGLTRARLGVELWWNEAVFVKAVARRAERHSGLRDLLSAPPAKIGQPRQEQLRLFDE